MGKHGQTAIDYLELRVDADFFAYRICQANEESLDWGDDITTIYSNFRDVVKGFEREITNLRHRFDTDAVTLYFSDTKNFRKTVDPEYKGNRTKRKPVGYKRLLDWCEENYKVVRIKNVEADDALGMDCHLNMLDKFVLISPDKDMKQICCRHFNGEEEFEVTAEDADRMFWTQCLTGDAVDGYKGVPGIGAVKAAKILKKATPETWWSIVVDTYEKAELTEEDALRNARCARILRPGEYNHTINEPVLWTPSQSQPQPQ